MRSALRLTPFLIVASIALAACGGGGGGGGGTPPTATPSPTPTTSSSADCPSSGAAPQTAFTGVGTLSAKRMRPPGSGQAAYVPGAIAVTYDPQRTGGRLDVAVARLGRVNTSDLSFDALGTHTRIVRVDPSREAQVRTALQSVPGVRSISRVAYRQRMTVTANDPYFVGFSGTSAPYFEKKGTSTVAGIPGQWDMHAINVSGGWNAVTSTAPVVGSKAPIAIIDTGIDLTQPEMKGGKVVRTRCFVTFPTSGAQSTGTFVTDTDGHGTNVAGIASADTNNSIGFAGASYDASLMAYRIFPSDPAGGCDVTNPPAQCDSDTADEAAAINDAVANGAKVINLSLGGGNAPCDTTDVEYQAVENAISHGVAVVAAAGNGDSNGNGINNLVCPAGDPGVIAVGASALNDSGASIVEKVASYSNYLSTHGTGSGGAFLVAPGGDPTDKNDPDPLHWIENIYSSTAVTFTTQACGSDYNGQNECTILFAGTSQATPHVAGVAALIIAARPGYTPAKVAAALCNSATNISDAKQGCGRVDATAAVGYAKTH